jgi:hypothetical protein
MKNPLKEDLARHAKLAFRRMRPGADLIKQFHALPETARRCPHLIRVYQWLTVPFSLWPVDIIGVAGHLFDLAKSSRKPSAEITELIELLGDPPSARTCDSIGAYEHNVKGGNYESLVKAQHKFDFREEILKENPGFLADWKWIKSHFDVLKHQGDNGVIRRRMVSERNFHPPDWNFRWKSVDDRFFNVFDAFCHKWVLYGMERDKPLLQKLSVNITPYGTMIVIPRYWSLDGHRDLRWRSTARLHKSRDVSKQGLKLGTNQKERRQQAEAARSLVNQAKQHGIKGEKRDQWVMARLGMHAETDRKQLWRLLKCV